VTWLRIFLEPFGAFVNEDYSCVMKPF